MDLVLVVGGQVDQRPHALRVGLLQHQAAADVRVGGDGDAGSALVHHLGEVRALDALLGVLQGVEVAGAQRRDGLRADHHPGVLDDLEHLRDAVVDVADQPALGRHAVLAERDLAGRGDLEAHLLLDVGHEGAVALAGVALGVEVVLRDEEQAQALGADAAEALDVRRAGKDQVDDVLGHVVLTGGDEALHALDVPGAVLLEERLRGAGADVGSGVGLGQDHGRAPLAVDHDLGPLLLLLVAEAVDDRREAGAGHVHVDGRVGAEHHLRDGPADGRRGAGAAEVLGQVQAPEAGLHECCVGLLEGLGHLDGHRLRVVLRRVAVRVHEGLGQRALAQGADLAQDLLDGARIELGVGAGAQPVSGTEDLEEVELDVAQIGLVVGHPISFGVRGGGFGCSPTQAVTRQ